MASIFLTKNFIRPHFLCLSNGLSYKSKVCVNCQKSQQSNQSNESNQIKKYPVLIQRLQRLFDAKLQCDVFIR